MENKQFQYADILEKIVDTVSNFVNAIPRIAEIEKMNTTEFYVFLFIATRQSVYNSQISLKLGIKKSSVSMILKKLAQKRLIEKSENQEDRRYHCICLSKRGKRVFSEFLSAFSTLANNLLDEIDENTLEKLTESFETINKFSQLVVEKNKNKHTRRNVI